ncbi:hypothetical protein ACO1O0_003042 [Amphichorda felina]
MSIFSHIRKSRQQAKEHNAKLAEQQKKEKQETMSYRHVPTHAASDAFASAPPTWREAADRPRIIEENRRRSAMGVNGSHTNMPGPNFPRVASGLSYVSYPGQENPRARMPRTYSYTGISPYPDSSRAIIHSIPNVAQFEPPCLKQDSPSESNSVSAGSQEDLAMRNYRNPIVASTASETVHRLHPSSRSRRTSDASIDRRSMSNSANHKSSPSTSPWGASQFATNDGYRPNDEGPTKIEHRLIIPTEFVLLVGRSHTKLYKQPFPFNPRDSFALENANI